MGSKEIQDLRKKAFEKVVNNDIENCKACELYKTKTSSVFGSGSLNADIMFIGEAPGSEEDLKGVPFVGRAGEVLSELLDYIGLKREDIFIANVLKCRPPNNAQPTESQILSCSKFLDQQIGLIKPKVICCLGNFATEYIFRKFGIRDQWRGITTIKGKIFKVEEGLVIIPLFHPAVATYDASRLGEMKKDFKVLLNFIGEKV